MSMDIVIHAIYLLYNLGLYKHYSPLNHIITYQPVSFEYCLYQWPLTYVDILMNWWEMAMLQQNAVGRGGRWLRTPL